jgi:hypothetical protein
MIVHIPFHDRAAGGAAPQKIGLAVAIEVAGSDHAPVQISVACALCCSSSQPVVSEAPLDRHATIRSALQ